MNSNELSKGILKAVAILFGIALTFFLIYKISTVLIYIIVSIVFTLIANPIVIFLKNKLKFKNTIAVITTLFLFLALTVGFFLMFVPLIIDQGENLSLLSINSLEKNYEDVINNLSIYLANYNIDVLQIINSANIKSSINFKIIPEFFNSLINTLGNFGMGVASVFFISFFLLKDRANFFVTFKSILPKSQKNKVLISIDKITNLLSRYFIGLLLQLLIIFILNGLVFLIFGVSNAFTIALLCAILNIIPYVGPIIGMFATAVLILISGISGDFINDAIPTTIYVLIGMFTVQLIDNNINQPIIFSKSTKSHPLEIFLVILISGVLFGIIGMIVAIPSYTVLKVIGKSFFPEILIIKALTKNI
ncbi:AI-2E family transporter [Flavobacterium sp.]|jgi:predicted PurR-regulated permease PerM|uniref:AI-2E family transporter n=1 Tax=Flavobacterium sp. TaxID=239 RepID=UPI002A82A002|nr:AI-2E family transporter [Flavobacterium sp.]